MSHRPYPPSSRPWAMFMRWHDLLFAHWPVRPDRLRAHVPRGLKIETFDGWAWLGVVPFRMSAIRHRLLPPIPGLSAFPELNVRTYVHPAGDPAARGVWFFSLDATSRVAVRVARATFGLSYMNARMTCEPEAGAIRYESNRIGPSNEFVYGPTRTRRAEFAARYRPTGPVLSVAPGSLESFLTDLYCLYSWRDGGIWRADIDHQPWPLQPAGWDLTRNTMTEPLGIGAQELGAAPMLHFAGRLDVVAWLPRRVQPAPAPAVN